MPVAPSVPRSPSLNALRAFEASARLGGFSKAAEELGVTPGAVAAQVKSLEEDIGAKLFQRHAKGIELTLLGRRVLPGFVNAFDSLAEAAFQLKQYAAPHKVHIATLPALAQLWLSPRLPELRRKIPEIDISVTALETPPNLKRVPFDICVFYSRTVPEGGVQARPEEILPVCAPELAQQLKYPPDLTHVACLTDLAWSGDWRLWADKAMPGEEFTPHGPVFSLYAVALQEALNGAGVLMAHKSLVADHLETGDLVAPFDLSVALPQKITVWILPGNRHGKTLQTVVESLL